MLKCIPLAIRIARALLKYKNKLFINFDYYPKKTCSKNLG